MDPTDKGAGRFSEEELKLGSYLEELISDLVARKAIEMFSKPQPDQLVPHRHAGQLPPLATEEGETGAEIPAEEPHATSPPGGSEQSAVVSSDAGAGAELEAAPDGDDEDAPVLRPPKKRGRSSMRSDLLELFRRTEAPSNSRWPTRAPSQEEAPTKVTPAVSVTLPAEGEAEHAVPTAVEAVPTSVEIAPPPENAAPAIAAPSYPVQPAVPMAPAASPFLERFLRQAASRADIFPSGIAVVDGRLAGGFAPGFHIVAGEARVGKTAFLEAIAWHALSVHRPVLYYALKEKALGAWMRFISTLGFVLGGTTVSLTELRSLALQSESTATLRSLDVSLQTAVLPRLSLVDTIPARVDALGAFVIDAETRAEELRRKHGHQPLVIVDDLDHLLLATGIQPRFAAVSRLDDGLGAASLTTLCSTTSLSTWDPELDRLPVQTLLELRSAPLPVENGLWMIDVSVRTNRRGNWSGDISLVLDSSSGLFAC